MDLTLFIIVKNEELNLPTCLKSFQGLYSQLVIVDTGSTDQTKAIAQSFGAEVYDFVWRKDFAAARNFAISKVKTPWVMMVDADDRISPQSLSSLLTCLENIPDNIWGVDLPYLYSAIQKNDGVMAYLPRIWRTSKKYHYTLPIHEYLDIPKADRAHFQRMSFPIIHNKTTENYQRSLARNLDILQFAHQKNPSLKRVVFYLGHDNHYAGNYSQAIYWYKKFISLKHKNRDELHKAYLGQALCWLKLNNLQQAKIAFRRAIKANQAFIDPYLYLGEMALREKRYGLAARYFFQSLDCQPPHTHVFVDTRLYRGYGQKMLRQSLLAIEQLKHV